MGCELSVPPFIALSLSEGTQAGQTQGANGVFRLVKRECKGGSYFISTPPPPTSHLVASLQEKPLRNIYASNITRHGFVEVSSLLTPQLSTELAQVLMQRSLTSDRLTVE